MADIWDAAAAAWERDADLIDAHLEAATDRLLDAVAAGAGSEVLEVACGPGGAGLAAARRGARVVLSDVAPAMVEAARRRAAGRPQVSALVCDQVAITAGDASFDAVVVRHGLMFVPEPADAVREAARILRPGGRYGAMVWDERKANPWLACLLDAVGEQFNTTIPPPGVPGPFSLGDGEALAAVLNEGGLAEVSVERLSTPLAIASLEEWWDRVPSLAGPLAQALAAMEPDVRDAIRARAIDHARAATDGSSLPGSVLIGVGSA